MTDDKINKWKKFEEQLQVSDLSPEDKDLWHEAMSGMTHEGMNGLFLSLFEQSPEEIAEFTELLKANLEAVETGNSDKKKDLERKIFSSVIKDAEKELEKEKSE